MFLDCSPVVLAVPVKICAKCGAVKPRDQFHKNKDQRDGLASSCRDCCNAYNRQYHADNRTAILERNRQYRIENHDAIQLQRRQFRAENRESRLEQLRQYRDEHRDEISNVHRQYYAVNRETIKDSQRKYRATHRQEKLDRERRRRVENPNIHRAYNQRKRARKRSLPNTLSAVDIAIAIDYFGGCCAVCGRPPGLWHTLAADHWIPLNSPDCPGTVPWNTVPLCHGIDGCNNSKNAKPPADWLIERFGPRKGRAILKRIEAFLVSRRPAS